MIPFEKLVSLDDLPTRAAIGCAKPATLRVEVILLNAMKVKDLERNGRSFWMCLREECTDMQSAWEPSWMIAGTVVQKIFATRMKSFFGNLMHDVYRIRSSSMMYYVSELAREPGKSWRLEFLDKLVSRLLHENGQLQRQRERESWSAR